jgi:hypothetical protein
MTFPSLYNERVMWKPSLSVRPPRLNYSVDLVNLLVALCAVLSAWWWALQQYSCARNIYISRSVPIQSCKESLELRQALRFPALLISPDVFIQLSCSGLFRFKLSICIRPTFVSLGEKVGLMSRPFRLWVYLRVTVCSPFNFWTDCADFHGIWYSIFVMPLESTRTL